MLASRLRTGISKRALSVAQYERMAEYIKADQIIDAPDTLVLTATGRLIADRMGGDLNAGLVRASASRKTMASE